MTREVDFRRLLTTINCEEPDYVPIVELSVDRVVKETFLGKPIADIKDDVDFWRQAGYDYIYLRPDYEYPGLPASVAVGTSLNRETERNSEEAASTLDNWRKIANEKEMDDFTWPDPETIDYSNLKKAAECLPEGMAVITGVGGIFTRVWMLLGFTEFCLNLNENPAFVKKMFDRIGSIQCRVLKKAIQMNRVGAFWYGDDLAYTEGLMVSPDVYRKYLLPWLEELFGIAHKAKLPVIMHTDGDVRLLVEDLIKIGLNALHPIEPKAMEITELKKRYEGRLCLFGNINLAGCLGRGTPDEVKQEVKKRIKDLAPGGGYAVGSSNSVTYYVPINNYRAMLEATFEFGRYPIR